MGRPYIALTLEGIEYADVWHKRQLIQYQHISKTTISTASLNLGTPFKLYIFIWDHQLQAKTGFGQHQQTLTMNIDPTHYLHLNQNFPTWLTLLKYMSLVERKALFESLNSNPDLDINVFIRKNQINQFRQNHVVLINGSITPQN